MKPFRELAARLLSTYSDRPDVAAAIQWCDKLLLSRVDERVTRELVRLRGGGVTGSDVISAALAVWAYAERFPGSLPDDARLTYALGRAVVRLRRKPSRLARNFRLQSSWVPGPVFRIVGMSIRETLGLLFARLLKLHQRDSETDAQLLATIRSGAPTDPPDLFTSRKAK